MEGSGDLQTFTIDLTSDGAARLREVIKQKLAEFMGSYTDDVLAEYVAVLVCHGKHQDQAKKDLDAFLGNHSGAFVAWLWDHIASNIHNYVPSLQTLQPIETVEQAKHCSEEAKRSFNKPIRKNSDAETKSKGDIGEAVSIVTHKEVNEKPNKAIGSRRRREWTSVHKSTKEVKEAPRQQTGNEDRNDSREGVNSHSKGKSVSKRRHSPEPWTRRERLRHDECQSDKSLHAPRRLLQSAVLDAVGPIGPANYKRLESSKNRLRSVVATNVENSDPLSDVVEASTKQRAFAKSLPAMAVAVKAAAAAAEDVAKVKSTGSVFDRLGKRLDNVLNGVHQDADEHIPDYEGHDIENTMSEGVYPGRKYQHRSEIRSRLDRRSMDDVAMMDSESVMPSHPISEGYDEVLEDERHMQRYGGASTRRKQLENRESDVMSRLSTLKDRQPLHAQQPDKHPEESVTVQYRVAQNSQEIRREGRFQKTSSEPPSASSKILNISVNVNTWKPTDFQPARDAGAMKTKNSFVDSNLLPAHAEMDIDGTLPKGTAMELQGEGQIVPPTVPNSASNADFATDIRKDTSISGVSTSVRTPEDADSRIIFVSNVHFAATKEALSKHFGRYGEVVKVIILTDAATSQPKGSAYIEFASKEMAEMALSLNETSFMSRMLKVLRKSSSNVEPSVLPVRPPLRRPLPFLPRRPSRYARGFPTAYRRGFMSRSLGSRSLQWRRDSSSGGTGNSTNDSSVATASMPANGGNPANSAFLQVPRPLTYIREASKSSTENAGQAQG